MNLRSFFDYGGSLSLSARTMIDPSQFRFFLDSGAYSAWSRGTVIDLDEYCAFIKANIEQIEVYASLDCIPGKPGRIATEAERNSAAEESWSNFLYMRNEGLDPMPVYHYGEHRRHLGRMLDFGCSYIGIGGLVGVPSDLRRLWLDELFYDLTDEAGNATVKTHGFGMTSIPLVFRYPWFSVDSTTWLKMTANGAVLVPGWDAKAQSFDFSKIPSTVTVSNANPNQAQDGKHYNSLGPSARSIIGKWLAICGQTIEGVSSHYYPRSICNATFFRMLAERRAEHRFEAKANVIRKRGLFA